MPKIKKKIGFTCGTYDLLHVGHIRMFQEAKTVCDYLIVGVQTDPSEDRIWKNKPIQTWEERAEMVASINGIDRIIKYTNEKSLYKLLTRLKKRGLIDVRILGEEYKKRKFTGMDLGIPIYFNNRKHNYSSSNIRKRIYKIEKNRK